MRNGYAAIAGRAGVAVQTLSSTWLSPGTPIRWRHSTGDVATGMLAPEMYLHFVGDRGWLPEEWWRWAPDALSALLRPRRSARASLSMKVE
ncbi:hypothetical protein ACQEVB_17000 [Pseudonocardia sp. CA-107938]|uniref:hypothetical protein n=1 Tax=Pseudonocardia sp. CA-107938 TaxID=3240021 RepID=UPI003D93F9D7